LLNSPPSYHQLAHALVEHETLNLEEVKKVIQGLPIRGLKDKVLEAKQEVSNDLSTNSEQPSIPTPTPT
jgi:ATP-dependent metalloprotease